MQPLRLKSSVAILGAPKPIRYIFPVNALSRFEIDITQKSGVAVIRCSMSKDVVIYHNPRCSKSRKALEILQQHGLTPVVVEYLKAPLDAGTLRSFGLPAREMIREDEDEYAALNLADPAKTEADLFDAIAQHPILLQRPIVVAGNRAIVARPPERVNELL